MKLEFFRYDGNWNLDLNWDDDWSSIGIRRSGNLECKKYRESELGIWHERILGKGHDSYIH